MSEPARALPPALAEARAAIDALGGFDVVRDFYWDRREAAWVLEVRLTSDHDDSELVPKHTGWHVLVSDRYPWGALRVYPSKKAGIHQTFWHQSLNQSGPDTIPWREGKVCLDAGVEALGREAEDEPHSSAHRLAWHLARLKIWVRAAADGCLAAPGEPFELPDFLTLKDVTVAFDEDSGSLDFWSQSPHHCGLMDVVRLRRKPDFYAVEAFRFGRNELVLNCSWGEYVENPQLVREKGVWIRIDRVPYLTPWKAPITWGELEKVVRNRGIELFEVLRSQLESLRDGKSHILGIGFPIPSRVGGAPQQMFWQFARLWSVSKPKRDGFRHGAAGAGWINDRLILFDRASAVPWVRSESWSPDDLVGRGGLATSMRDQKVAVVGCGALGSAVSELLVRGGVRNLVLADSDTLAAGNLVRHVLTLDDLGTDKAEGLGRHLRSVSPHARVEVVGLFPPEGKLECDLLQERSVVIDTTGDNAVVHALANFGWREPKLFLSLSLGMYARVAYCFAAWGRAFPATTFHEMVTPWLQAYRDRHGGQELPRDGLGCWHPLFPARQDALWTLASAAVPWLERYAMKPPRQPDLVLLETDESRGPRTVTVRRGAPDE